MQCTVLLTTSDKKGAGTSSSLWIELIGPSGSSGRKPLYNTSANAGEAPLARGSTSKFEVESGMLGPLSAIRVGHDGAGANPAWHLDKAKVRCEKDKRKFLFVCRKWLAGDMADGRTEREVLVTEFETPLVQYEVYNNMTSFYGSSCANNGKDALNNPERYL